MLDSDSLAIEISGTATSGTTYFEIKVTPDGEYYPIAGARTSDYEISTYTNGINEAWSFEIGPYYSIRCRVENIVGGYITIKSKISKNN